MPAPLEHVHVQVRRVGQLQEEQLLAGDVGEPGRVAAAGEHVEAVQAQAERRVVGPPHGLPRAVPGRHLGAPGQRLVGEPQPALLGPCRRRGQLLGEPVEVGDGVRGDRGADQDRVGAQVGHDVELALEAPQVAGEALLIGRVEVAERLVQVDREPGVGAPSGEFGRRPRRADQVGLEHLDAVEAGLGGRGQLVLEGARQAHRRDRPAGHRLSRPGRPARASRPAW